MKTRNDHHIGRMMSPRPRFFPGDPFSFSTGYIKSDGPFKDQESRPENNSCDARACRFRTLLKKGGLFSQKIKKGSAQKTPIDLNKRFNGQKRQRKKGLKRHLLRQSWYWVSRRKKMETDTLFHCFFFFQ